MRLNRLLVPLVLVAMALALAPFIGLAFLAVPTADDFCYAVIRTSKGVVDAVVHLYHEAQGRFANHFVMSLLAAPDNLVTRYPTFPIAFLVLAYGSLAFLCHQLLGRGTSQFIRHALPVVVLLAILTRAPEPSETVYWLSGASGYLLGATVFAAALAAMLPCLETSPSGQAQWLLPAIVSVPLIVLATALHEQYGFALLALVGSVFLTRLILRRPRGELAITLVLGICSAIALAAVVFSPGHAARIDASTEGAGSVMLAAQAMKGLVYTIVMVPYLSATWLSDLLVLVIALVLFLATAQASNAPTSEARPARGIALAVALWCAAMGAAYPALTTIGIAFDGRSQFPLYFVFLLAVLATARALAPYARTLVPSALTQAPPSLFLLVALVLVICSPRYLDAFLDLRDNRSYRVQVIAALSDARAQSAEGKRHVVLSSLPATPALIHGFDVKSWPEHWVNWCLANFFKLESIRRSASNPPPASHWAHDARVFDLEVRQ